MRSLSKHGFLGIGGFSSFFFKLNFLKEPRGPQLNALQPLLGPKMPTDRYRYQRKNHKRDPEGWMIPCEETWSNDQYPGWSDLRSSNYILLKTQMGDENRWQIELLRRFGVYTFREWEDPSWPTAIGQLGSSHSLKVYTPKRRRSSICHLFSLPICVFNKI